MPGTTQTTHRTYLHSLHAGHIDTSLHTGPIHTVLLIHTRGMQTVLMVTTQDTSTCRILQTELSCVVIIFTIRLSILSTYYSYTVYLSDHFSLFVTTHVLPPWHAYYIDHNYYRLTTCMYTCIL